MIKLNKEILHVRRVTWNDYSLALLFVGRSIIFISKDKWLSGLWRLTHLSRQKRQQWPCFFFRCSESLYKCHQQQQVEEYIIINLRCFGSKFISNQPKQISKKKESVSINKLQMSEVWQTFVNQNCFCHKKRPVSLIYKESIKHKILRTFRFSADFFFWMESPSCKHNSVSKYQKGLHKEHTFCLWKLT